MKLAALHQYRERQERLKEQYHQDLNALDADLIDFIEKLCSLVDTKVCKLFIERYLRADSETSLKWWKGLLATGRGCIHYECWAGPSYNKLKNELRTCEDVEYELAPLMKAWKAHVTIRVRYSNSKDSSCWIYFDLVADE